MRASRVFFGFAVLFAAVSSSRAHAGSVNDSTRPDFDAGTYNGTAYDAANKWVRLYNDQQLPDATNSSWADMTGNIFLYHMNANPATGASVVADSSGNGINGTLTTNDALNKAAAGRFGFGVSLDGVDDHIALPTATFGGAFSFEAWVYSRNPAASSSRIFESGVGPSNENFGLGFNNTSRQMILFVARGATLQFVQTTAQFPANQWVHVVATLDNSSNAVIYWNGVVQAAGTVQTPNSLERTQNYLGRSLSAFDSYFNGVFDEVAMYSRALTAADVLSHYSYTAGTRPITFSTPLVLPDNADANGWCDMTGNVVMLHMNENPVGNGTVIANTSGNPNNAAYVSNDAGTGKSVPGYFGRALDFDGNGDYATISSTIQIGGPFSVEAWVYARSTAPNWSRVVDFGNGANSDNIVFTFYGTTGRMCLSIRQGVTEQAIFTDDAFPVNQWIHVAAVTDGTANGAAIYWNGIVKARGTVHTPLTIPRSGQYIARSAWYPGDADFNGMIDELAVYNRALTGTEVTNHYVKQTSVATGSFADLEQPDNQAANGNTALYHMNDGRYTDGAVVRDFSGNNNHATVRTLDGKMDKTAPGKIGTAINFDGVDDYIQIPNSLQFTAPFSYDGWVYARNTVPIWQRIFDFGNGAGADNFLLAFAGGGGQMWLETYRSTGAGHIVTNASFPLNQWVHVAATIDANGNACIYWNGALQASGNIPVPDPAITRTRQYIGLSNWGFDAKFDGMMDEYALYNRVLTPEEVQAHYSRQPAPLNGTFTSRALDAGSTAGWTTLNWTTQSPVNMPLPDNGQVETAFPAGNTDMNGNILLLHLNEADLTADSPVADTSPSKFPCALRAAPGSAGHSVDGKFAGALNLNGNAEYVELDSTFQITGAFSMETWVFMRNLGAPWQRIFDFAEGLNGNDNIMFGWYGASGRMYLEIWDGLARPTFIATDNVFPTNQWVHVAVTVDANGAAVIYWNGVPTPYTGTIRPPHPNPNRRLQYIGKSNFPADSYFNGLIDEFAMYNRVLTPAEMQNHYLRGATNLKYQLRASEDPAFTGANFAGPDGTSNTFFIGSMSQTAGQPNVAVSNPPIGRYVQYRGVFESIDLGSSPELLTVGLTYAYAPSDLTLSNKTIDENLPAGTDVGTLETVDSTVPPDTFTYSLVLGAGAADNAAFTISGNTLKTAAKFDYEAKKTYSIRVRTKGTSGLFIERTFSIDVNDVNDAPVLAAIGAKTVNEGSLLSFDAVGTDQDAGQTLQFTLVSAPVGAAITSGGHFTFTPADGSVTFSAKVIVTDSANPALTAEETISITVKNVAPSLNVSGATEIDEGSTYTLSLTGFADPAGGNDALIPGDSFIDWGDGSQTPYLVATETYIHKYPDGISGGTARTITVTLTDEDGTYTAGTIGLTVNNVAPAINGVSVTPGTINENELVTINGTIDDPGISDTFTLTINWGDPNLPDPLVVPLNASPDGTQTFQFEHQYLNDPAGGSPNEFTITITIADSDFDSNETTQVVTVRNVSPSDINVTASSATINEGDSVTLSATFADAGTLDGHTIEINWGDGSSDAPFVVAPPARSFSGRTHQYKDNPNGQASGNYFISVKVTDDENSASGSKQIVINNVAPKMALSGNVGATPNIFNLVMGDIVDPGQDTVTNYLIEWGDEQSDSLSAAAVAVLVPARTLPHTYAAGTTSIPPINVYVTDEDGTFLAGVLQIPTFTSTVLHATGELGSPFIYNLVADGGLTGSPAPTLTFNAVDLPGNVASLEAVGISLVGTTFTTAFTGSTGVLNFAGEVAVELTATNPAGSTIVYLIITITRPSGNPGTPQVVSGPTATPLPAVVGANINFTVTATDSDGDLLTFTWNFADGTSARRATATHAFAAAGVYDVTLTISDGVHQVQRHLAITVLTSNTNTFSVTSAKIAFNFTAPTKDSMALAGAINLPIPSVIPNLTGAVARVEIAGSTFVHEYTLSSKGAGGDKNNALSFKLSKPGATVTAAKFKLTVKGPLFESLSPLGFTNENLKKPPREVSMPLIITVPKTGTPGLCNFKVLYTAVAGKSGKAALKK